MSMKVDPRKQIISFAKDNASVEALKFITEDPDGFGIDDFSAHGMMNTILRVRSRDRSKSVIIKYGETTSRIEVLPSGSDSSLVSLDRQVLEFDSLELLQEIQPGSAPRPYCLDRNYNIIAMEDMGSWDLLGSQLQAGRVDLEAASRLGVLLATMHVATTEAHVSPQRWHQLVDKFSQDALIDEVTRFLYARTFEETAQDNKIPPEALESYRQYVKEIKAMKLPEKLTELFNVKECFIHTDCHWKSVFVKDGQAALLDFEFAFLGPAAQNLGTVFTAYLFCYNDDDPTKEVTPERAQFKADCTQAVRAILTAYMDKHPDICDEGTMAKFLKDVALFTGAALVLLGLYVAMDEFDFHTDTNRTFLMTRGFEVMKAHEQLTTIGKFINVLFDI